MIFGKIFQNPLVEAPDDFGVLVTKKNIDTLLSVQRMHSYPPLLCIQGVAK
jgi:hypothetical protein